MKRLVFILTILIFNTVSVYSQQNLKKPFKECGIEGSITIYDLKAKKWIASDIQDSQFPTLPASTFKIINTLIALESGVIKCENEIIKWPGATDTIKYGYRPGIYHDMTMKDAFKASAGWAYVELSKKIGKEKYTSYLTECKYGNMNISTKDPDFWNFGDFAISPANQIEILKGIYEETLPFKKESFAILKNMMMEEQSESYILRAKTGWTRDGGKDAGWWVGYVERKDNVYFLQHDL
ncbi:MAG TPA: penicillin-binding transpeptidase domain-containing protein [Prolixibacteraceae bacterium]|nr:penicillin-binding transpeptidase domain-containing protein [Prolixibacteraceae bacterium]